MPTPWPRLQGKRCGAGQDRTGTRATHMPGLGSSAKGPQPRVWFERYGRHLSWCRVNKWLTVSLVTVREDTWHTSRRVVQPRDLCYFTIKAKQTWPSQPLHARMEPLALEQGSGTWPGQGFRPEGGSRCWTTFLAFSGLGFGWEEGWGQGWNGRRERERGCPEMQHQSLRSSA